MATHKYPIYVISKGRWKTPLTANALESMGANYRVIIEPQELQQYEKIIPRNKILVLPFSNLGQGSIPARNWCWEHSITEGFERHWIVDDNIRDFYRYNRNLRIRLKTDAGFRAMEEFTDRYTNVSMSGPHYRFFVDPKFKHQRPILINTRVYSCILLSNKLTLRWRGRYNEDTDLSLRILKQGLCTILFRAFLCDKMHTMTMKGGNTDQLYKGDGRLMMAQSLRDQHPDVVTIKRRWGRWQHVVDYRPFRKNKLKLKPGISLSNKVDEFGMRLINVPAE